MESHGARSYRRSPTEKDSDAIRIRFYFSAFWYKPPTDSGGHAVLAAGNCFSIDSLAVACPKTISPESQTQIGPLPDLRLRPAGLEGTMPRMRDRSSQRPSARSSPTGR